MEIKNIKYKFITIYSNILWEFNSSFLLRKSDTTYQYKSIVYIFIHHWVVFSFYTSSYRKGISFSYKYIYIETRKNTPTNIKTLKCNKSFYGTIRICVYENKIWLNFGINLFIVKAEVYKICGTW